MNVHVTGADNNFCEEMFQVSWFDHYQHLNNIHFCDHSYKHKRLHNVSETSLVFIEEHFAAKELDVSLRSCEVQKTSK